MNWVGVTVLSLLVCHAVGSTIRTGHERATYEKVSVALVALVLSTAVGPISIQHLTANVVSVLRKDKSEKLILTTGARLEVEPRFSRL